MKHKKSQLELLHKLHSDSKNLIDLNCVNKAKRERMKDAKNK